MSKFDNYKLVPMPAPLARKYAKWKHARRKLLLKQRRQFLAMDKSHPDRSDFLFVNRQNGMLHNQEYKDWLVANPKPAIKPEHDYHARRL